MNAAAPTLTLTRGTLIDMFKASPFDFKTADKWDKARTEKKVASLLETYGDGANVTMDDPALNQTFHQILAVLKAGGTVAVEKGPSIVGAQPVGQVAPVQPPPVAPPQAAPVQQQAAPVQQQAWDAPAQPAPVAAPVQQQAPVAPPIAPVAPSVAPPQAAPAPVADDKAAKAAEKAAKAAAKKAEKEAKAAAKAAARAANPGTGATGPAGVRFTVTRPYLAGVIIRERGLGHGITADMVQEVNTRFGVANDAESMFCLRNAWHAHRGFLGIPDEATMTRYVAATSQPKS